MRVVIILLVLFAGTASAYGLLYSNEEPLTVKVMHPAVGNIESSIRVTGRVVNDRTVIITALIDGEIREMNVRKGDSVEAGQVLAVLDQREAEALVEKRRGPWMD